MISVIVAVSRGGVIGAAGRMPWHIAEDLRYFKRMTTGAAVVMGRRTFESLGRPLPGRTNVVVTRDAGFAAAGVVAVHSLEEAVRAYPDAFVIGGGDIYRQAMPMAGRLYITRIEADFEGDTLFPEWDSAEWRLVSSEPHGRGEAFPHPFRFEVYERVGK